MDELVTQLDKPYFSLMRTRPEVRRHEGRLGLVTNREEEYDRTLSVNKRM